MLKFHGRSQRIYTENVELSERRFHSEKQFMFSVQITSEKFEDAIIVLVETRSTKSRACRDVILREGYFHNLPYLLC